MTPHDWIHVFFGCAIIVLFMRTSVTQDSLENVCEATLDGVQKLCAAINNLDGELKDHKRHGAMKS
jgi:hypothetical protein